MSLRVARGGAALFFLLFVVAVTWPGMVPFNRIRPLVLGLPFSMVWIALWVCLSFFVLLLVDLVEGRSRGTGSVLPLSEEGGNFPSGRGSSGPAAAGDEREREIPEETE